MFSEYEFKEHLKTLSKEQIIELCVFWRKKGSDQYWKLRKDEHERTNLMTEL